MGSRRLWNQVGPLPIPVSEIKAFLGLVGVSDPSTCLKYVRLIGKMDDVERNYLFEKSKSK